MAEQLGMFGPAAKPRREKAAREADEPDGYAALHGVAAREDADRLLRARAEAEVARPAWRNVAEEVRRAYVRLYGRRAAPGGKEPWGWAERAAVMMAVGVAHDVDGEEREAIRGEAA